MGIAELLMLCIYILVIALLVYVVHYVLSLMELPDPIRRIAALIVAIIGLLWILQRLGIL